MPHPNDDDDKISGDDLTRFLIIASLVAGIIAFTTYAISSV